MRRLGMLGLACLLLGGLAHEAWGDEFDRIEGEALAQVPRSKEARPHESLGIGELETLPSVLHDAREAFLVVTTDQGNPARLLVSPAFRKAPARRDEAEPAAAPVPVLVFERFDTFESGNLGTRLAHGKELILFDGFQLDLDSGQVVPPGQGGDLQFRVEEGKGPRLYAVGGARLYSLTKPLPGVKNAVSRPTIGRGVLPSDFRGRYHLYANGQWSGLLELKVDGAGMVSGRFRSDLNGTAYPVTGKVSAEVPHRISFTVKYPRTEQEFEGLLWTEGKGALAGTLTMLGRVYGFFAVREGGRLAPEGEDVGPLAKGQAADRPGRRTVRLGKGQYTLDGKPQTDRELTDALKRAVAAEPATWVLLQVPADAPFSAVNEAFEVIGAAGVAAIHLAPADPEP
jgi:hypothetical protein